MNFMTFEEFKRYSPYAEMCTEDDLRALFEIQKRAVK